MKRLPKGVQQTTVRLPPELLDQLARLARDRDCTRNVLISDLLTERLDSEQLRLQERPADDRPTA